MTLCAINRCLPFIESAGGGEVCAGRDATLTWKRPFIEGVRHIKEGVFHHRPDEHSPSPKERMLHVIAGILLLIPIINIVGFLILRFFSTAIPIEFYNGRIADFGYRTLWLTDRFKSSSVQWPFGLPPVDYCRDRNAGEWFRKNYFDSLEGDALKEWIQEGKTKGYLNLHFFGGETALHRLAYDQFIGDPITEVMQSGIDLFARNNEGNTALHNAIANAQNRAAHQIILSGGRGDQLDCQCLRGNTPLHLTIGKGYTTRSADNQPLTVSNFQLTQALLERGANPNLSNRHGNTPLHLACLRRDIPTIRALLNHGADRTLVNYNGKRAEDLLHMSYYDVVAILKDTAHFFLLDKKQWAANHSGALAALNL